ncbi:hypothetical protein RI129_000084, partial [Pyrocoelia pectoralis]
SHIGHCGYEPIYCENKCGLKIQRRVLSQHKSSDCFKRLVACRYCKKDFVADTMATHHVKCGRVPVVCPNRCEITDLIREDMELHLKDQCTISLLNCSFKEAGCRFKGPRYLMDKHLEENSSQHLSLVCTLVTKQQHQIASLKSALSHLSLTYSGTMIWKVGDFAAKMSEAKTKEGMELVSPPFYTSQYGYNHISIYIKILPGEYDALLRWPFEHSVSFTLFDQSTCPEKACNIMESLFPIPHGKIFKGRV